MSTKQSGLVHVGQFDFLQDLVCESQSQSIAQEKSLHTDVGISHAVARSVKVFSKRQNKRLEYFEMARTQREEGKQDLGYNSRPFILCGLPVRRPPATVSSHVRTNGRFILEVTGDREYGLPFGQDRLIPIWIATLAVRQKDKTVRFRCAAELLRTFRLPLDGKTYRRTVEGFKRIATSKITFRSDESSTSPVWECLNFQFFDSARLWFARSIDQETLADDEFSNVIVLSDQFWREIQNHPIPIELLVVCALKDSPACLDLYCWVVWRCWKAKYSVTGDPVRIPLKGLQGQFGIAEQPLYAFRRRLKGWLVKIHQIWPECPARLPADSDYLELQQRKAIIGR